MSVGDHCFVRNTIENCYFSVIISEIAGGHPNILRARNKLLKEMESSTLAQSKARGNILMSFGPSFFYEFFCNKQGVTSPLTLSKFKLYGPQ